MQKHHRLNIVHLVFPFVSRIQILLRMDCLDSFHMPWRKPACSEKNVPECSVMSAHWGRSLLSLQGWCAASQRSKVKRARRSFHTSSRQRARSARLIFVKSQCEINERPPRVVSGARGSSTLLIYFIQLSRQLLEMQTILVQVEIKHQSNRTAASSQVQKTNIHPFQNQSIPNPITQQQHRPNNEPLVQSTKTTVRT